MKLHVATLSLAFLSAGADTLAQPAAPAPAAPAAALVKPGLWETTTAIEDNVSTNRRSIVSRICVRADEAQTAQKIIPVQRERGMECANGDIKGDGTAWTWTVSCRSAEATQSGTGKIVLSGNAYLGRAELDLRRRGAKAVKVKQTFSGNWIQGCV